MLVVGCGVSDVKVAQIASQSPNAGIPTEKTEINGVKQVFFITNPYDLKFFVIKRKKKIVEKCESVKKHKKLFVIGKNRITYL